MYQNKYSSISVQPKLAVRFYRTGEGREPVRDWLKRLSDVERRAVGDEIRTVQFSWPVGMPVVRKLEADLWEVRVRCRGRALRVLFAVYAGEGVLLHGFAKQSQKTPRKDLELARSRLAALARGGHRR